MANKSLAAAQKAYKKGQNARATAAKKGVVTSQRPQKKKKRREEEEPVRQQPKTTSISKPKQTSSPKPSAMQTDKSKRYESFKKSSVAPKITNTSKTTQNKPKSNLEDARQAYQKGKNRTYLGTEQKETTTKVGKKTKLKSVNALTRSEFNRMTEASRYGKDLGNKVLKGNKNLGQKDIREKVGSKTAE